MSDVIQIPAWTVGTNMKVTDLSGKPLGEGRLTSFTERAGSTTYQFEDSTVVTSGDHLVEVDGKKYKVSMLNLP